MPNDAQTSLREILKGRFLLGAALNDAQIAGQDPRALAIVARHFNSISPENVLKWDAIHPEPDRFEFAAADQFAALGAKHGLFVVGHALVWHEQTPSWVFEGAPGTALDPELLLSRLRTHIRTVVGRYRGRVHGWDVVNEAFEDDGTWRKTPWYTTLGEEFVAKAFEFAHQADPDAQLYYNDYNLWKMPKCKAAVRLVRSLGERGIRIDGVGEQAHWVLAGPGVEEIEPAVVELAETGAQVMFTELDIDPLPRPEGLIGADISKRIERTPELDPYAEGLPEGVQQRLAKRYGDVFDMFVKHRAVSRVTFWNVTDADTWLNNWPVPGRTNHPLLWDRRGRPKPAFYAVVEALRRAASRRA
ncbi:MAG: endo-1,4-beta-xylanase [Bryobacteraceae bacterium]